MNWVLLAQIIAKEGLPIAEAIWKKWTSGAEPTEQDFAELRGLATQDAAERLKAALVKKGIPLDSPQAVQLLALVEH